MSFDPYGGYTPDRPPDRPPDQPPAQPLGGQYAGAPVPGGPPPPTALVRERVIMPAIFLMVVGVLNLVAAIALMVGGFGGSRISDEMFEKATKDDPSQAARMKQLKDAGYTYQDLRNMYLYGGLGGGVVALLVSLLIVAGGICMVRLRGYGLSIFASLLAAVPCLSPMACPCLIGLPIGIWALVVLMAPDVREAFP